MATQIQTSTREYILHLLSSSKVKTFSDLPGPDQAWFAAVFTYNQGLFDAYNFKNPAQAFNSLKQNHDLLDIFFVPTQQLDKSVVPAGLLNHLVQQMHQDQQSIAASLKTNYSNLPTAERLTLQLIIETLQNQRFQKQFEKDEKLAQKTNQTLQDSFPKKEPLKQTQALSHLTTQAILKQEEINLPAEKVEKIEAAVTAALSNNPKKNISDKDLPLTPQEALIIATTVITISLDPTDPNLAKLADNPIAETALNLNKNFRNLTAPDYLALTNFQLHLEDQPIPPPNHIYLPGNEAIIVLPKQEDLATQTEIEAILSSTIKNNPSLQTESARDILDNANQEIIQLSQTLNTNPQLLDIAEGINPPLNQNISSLFIQAGNLADPTIYTRSSPSSQSQKASAILQEAGPQEIDLAVATSLASMGLNTSQLAHLFAIAQAQPNSQIGQFYSNNPKVFVTLSEKLNIIENTATSSSPNYYSEISQTTTRLRSFFQPISNRLTARLPLAVSKPLNIVLHPLDSLKGWLGKKAGQAIVKKLPIQILKNQAAKSLLNQGIKQGATFLIKAGIKGVAQIIAQFANVIPGLGFLIGAAIEVADLARKYLIQPLLKNILAPLMDAFVSIWGEKPKLGRDLAAAGALAATMAATIPSVLAAAGSAAFAATTAAGTTLIIASGITIIFYFAAFNMGPIIASLAQMGMPVTGGITAGIGQGTTSKDFDLNEVPSLPQAPTGAEISDVAQRAWDIVNGLRRGFWGYWNNYPGFFNQDLFDKDHDPPYPGPIQNDPLNLFWCTQLVAQAYGYTVGGTFLADEMMHNIGATPVGNLTYSNVKSGDIIFFDTNPSDGRDADHAAIVYSVTQDSIVFLQSNAATTHGTITISQDGSLQNLPGIKIVAIGAP